VATWGVVQAWNAEQDEGVIESVDTPGGCSMIASNVESLDGRALVLGEHVAFEYEILLGGRGRGYQYRATWVRVLDRSDLRVLALG
jgi:hypothetical protein